MALSAMLMTYILTGLLFMLLPGTFLGVWNLLSTGKLQARLDSGARSRTDLWLGGHLYLGHWFLFHPQAAKNEAVLSLPRLGLLGGVDRRLTAAPVGRDLALALAHFVAGRRAA